MPARRSAVRAPVRYTISRFRGLTKARNGTRATTAVSDSSTTMHRTRVGRVGQHRNDVEARRRDEHPVEGGQRVQPAGVDAGLLAGLSQRGVHRAGVPRIGGPAGESRLAGVMAQGAGPHRQQQVGIVGNQPRRVLGVRTGEQHQHRGVPPGPAASAALPAPLSAASNSGGTRRR